MNNDITDKIKKFASCMRKDILEMSLSAGASSSHFGGALSIVDIISTLFVTQIKFTSSTSDKSDRDRLILSKGHACLAYYAALSQIGILKKEELRTFEKDDSSLLGHPVKNEEIGIDFSTGSLGMGLSLGIGVAIALKKKKINRKVFVILGDGECNEGSVWEAAMSAANLKLDNIFVIIDRNNYQQTGKNSEIMDLKDLASKWKSFGWNVREINGHDVDQLQNYFKTKKDNEIPQVLIADTIKGKGFSFSENNNEWHHNVLTKTFYEKAIEELKIENDN